MRRLSVVFTVALLAAALAACSSSKADNKTNDSTAQTLGTQLTQRQKDERDITRVVKGWYRDFDAAKAAPDKPHPELSKWASQEVVGQAKARLREFVTKHQRSKRPPNSRAAVEVVSLKRAGDQYRVTTCELNDLLLVNTDSGAMLNGDIAIYRGEWEATKQPGGGWQLSRTVRQTLVGNSAEGEWESKCAR